jgi:hypothetical protein
MSEERPISHEGIEQAFKPAAEVIAKLPDTTETREARRLVDVAERLTHESRERTQPCTD